MPGGGADVDLWGVLVHGVVEKVERLSPGMIRVILGGAGLDGFVPTTATDAYLNIALAAPGAPYEMPCDLGAVRELPREQRPYRRRYTVRFWDDEARLLGVDFVVHGATGAAGPWASSAAVGDVLQFEGPSGGYAPDPAAAWHLLAGDESALPAIAASLEAMDSGARAVVRVVVDDPGHELPLHGPDQLDVRWLHRDGAADAEDLLPAALRDLSFPPGSVRAFVHGEADEIRQARRHLLGERGLSRRELSVSPYWRRHHADEAWREVKGAWTAAMERDVA